MGIWYWGSHLQQTEESSPKIDENKEKILNEEIQNYFLAKNKIAKISNIKTDIKKKEKKLMENKL